MALTSILPRRSSNPVAWPGKYEDPIRPSSVSPTTPQRPERPLRPSYYSNYSVDKPLPNPGPQRPGTSDTADTAQLQLHIRRMSEELRQAQKTERLYRARKRVNTGRANRTEAKKNFKESVQHFSLGLRLTWAVLVGMPVYLWEKQKLRGQTLADSPASSPRKSKSMKEKGKLADRDGTPEEGREANTKLE
ncbi:hypothetical protein QBC47DRAFT_381856 [Echria macrotheca]|uniref:Uncharacterized protein n=1 Tax=Echria macrotheca TaxID=438768 RepID=A0AAJ0BCZ3_9PEZI|nr:hypothetical protein QBC47DRAFT_381856 [Echria macrotheca]